MEFHVNSTFHSKTARVVHPQRLTFRGVLLGDNKASHRRCTAPLLLKSFHIQHRLCLVHTMSSPPSDWNYVCWGRRGARACIKSAPRSGCCLLPARCGSPARGIDHKRHRSFQTNPHFTAFLFSANNYMLIYKCPRIPPPHPHPHTHPCHHFLIQWHSCGFYGFLRYRRLQEALKPP